jgi:predicted Rossmann fold nucleotide-binding protein DprA/Smf involved in DNA uptake
MEASHLSVGVVGSRSFMDYRLLKEVLDSIHCETPISLIVSGGAKGADLL